MESPDRRAVAIVGVGAVMPDAPDAPAFWSNLASGRSSITEVPEDRWDASLYWDADPTVPDRTYSKIGGWVREFHWDPLGWKLPIPPKVSDAMDRAQKWAIIAAREALADFGHPGRSFDTDRTAVILGNAMGGDLHYRTAQRIHTPDLLRELSAAPSFAGLPDDVRAAVVTEVASGVDTHFPPITEDTMPGELANIIAGRIANLFNFHGPNYVVDAACASTMAAFTAAVEGLVQNDYDVVLTGGVDANMSASTFTKFCKIGALSATGTRPYAEGADGFVMGEGAALFVLKRLADAERDGDRIYAVIRGMGGASDGRGKGITAPNPIGQRLAVERAWARAGVVPDTATVIEGHGTSTRVGDVIEVEAMTSALERFGLPPGSVALGSVKSNIGHLKGAAGAAGILKAALSLHHGQIPPSINCQKLNPNVDFSRSPLFVNTELRTWEAAAGQVRRAGVSAFGFGGTNFHVVLEEHVPGLLTRERSAKTSTATSIRPAAAGTPRTPLRGALVVGADDARTLRNRLETAREQVARDGTPAPAAPAAADLAAPERIAIDFGDAEELLDRIDRALKALDRPDEKGWKALRARGVHRGSGPAGKVAFLCTGQGSQYGNMLATMRHSVPEIRETFEEADAVMTPILGKPLSDYVFIDTDDSGAMAELEEHLRQTEITQPAVLTTDYALTRLLGAYGVSPDMVIGHSLGEYGALVAADGLAFGDALRAVSARAHAMREVSMEDNGCMAAVAAPLDELEKLLEQVDGYVVIANLNSTRQAVIGGATRAVEEAEHVITAAGYAVRRVAVSHAFHTEIVAPASGPLTKYLSELDIRPPSVPVVANVTGGFYPMDPGARPQMIDLLGRQIASPVQFVKGLRTLYDQGVRVFVEVGPKRALESFAQDVLGDLEGVTTLFTNHPKTGDVVSFNQALCGLYAAGLGTGTSPATEPSAATRTPVSEPATATPRPAAAQVGSVPTAPAPAAASDDRVVALGRMFVDFLEKSFDIYSGGVPSGAPAAPQVTGVVISGAAMGLPGSQPMFDEANLERILRGDSFIVPIPMKVRQAMIDKHITRLVKTDAGGPRFETIESIDETIKLAGRPGPFDLREFGVPEDRIPALNGVTRMAMAVGIEALRDAGLPLVMRYRRTTTGGWLPDRWMLPESLADDTGVIFASAFPVSEAVADEVTGYDEDRALRARVRELTELREVAAKAGEPDPALVAEIDARIRDAERKIGELDYSVDRRLLFRILSMGHSQFAEHVGARGPNTQVNSACASTPTAVSIAEDWIRSGRCRRVVIVSADNVTGDRLLEWIGAGFLASGAAATDEKVEDAALPFDRRRHGMIVGMGAAALVVEAPEAVAERGMQPICEVLSTIARNSAFHGTRLDVSHIKGVMEALVSDAERRWGIDRHAIAPETVFVSHETYTPARGGSAQAEIDAIRAVFGHRADDIVMANTKGFTGHAMATGIEDVLAVRTLETGIVPPVANFREVDPDLGALHLSKGGSYPVRYSLRLGAGFGSQIAMMLLRWVPTPDGRRRAPREIGAGYRTVDRAAHRKWLQAVSGYDAPELEIADRTLRIRDDGPPAARPADRPAVALPAEAASAPQPTPSSGDGAAAPEPSGGTENIRDRVMSIVSGVTGYPPDMLDPELDLEADLGIDTVKQAETFAAVREAFDIPREDSLQLRDFPTLESVVGFVLDRRPDLASAPAPAAPASTPALSLPAATAPAAPAGGSDPVADRVLAIVAEVTGYPPDMLDPDLDLEADLGIDTVKQAETFAAVREAFDIPREDSLQLRDFPTLAHVVAFARDRSGAPAPASPVPSTQPATPTTAPAVLEPEAITGMGDGVLEAVIGIVAEQTGYPVDMLDPDLDLEADLGVDTVKQAEMFAAVRSRYGIERDETLQLRDFPTLADVARFVRERVPATPAPAGGDGIAAPAESPKPAKSGARATRRVPVVRVVPPVERFVPTGVTLANGDRIVLKPDSGGVAKSLKSRLAKRGVEVLEIDGDPDRDELNSRLDAWKADGPIRGVYWLAALDVEKDVRTTPAPESLEALRVRAKLLYTTARSLYDGLGEGSFFIGATRLDGRHGFGGGAIAAPFGGAVTGFLKALRRERPDSVVKAIDFAPDVKKTVLADRLIDEALCDPAGVEIGYADDLRHGVGLDVGILNGAPVTLPADPVFVVTGAAGSIVSAIVADLAARFRGTYWLLDLAGEPGTDDPDLDAFAADPDGLRRTLFNRLKESGERATPALVERQMAGIERRVAARTAIRAVEEAGGTARYASVDLLDPDAVARVAEHIRAEHEAIDVVLHAAGLEISRMLPDKEPGEFDLVFDVKTAGYVHLLASLGSTPVGAAVVFSSIAGRFGNGGQTDYSAANDFLAKTTASLGPDTRGITIDWTAWADIGMASRGSIPTMMARAGIGMLPPALGIPVVGDELESGSSGEIVIAESLGAMLEPVLRDGGLRAPDVGPMLENVIQVHPVEGVTFGVSLDPSRQPFLFDHRIDGTAVLPGVMGIEAFVEAARALVPERVPASVEEIRFSAPFKFYRDEPRTVEVVARAVPDGGDVLVHCRLVGRRRVATQEEEMVTVHFAGTVRMARFEDLAGIDPPATVPAHDDVPGADDLYAVYFHGPAYRVIESVARDESGVSGRLRVDLPPNHVPSDRPLSAAPRLIELAFQTAGTIEMRDDRVMGLPSFIRRVRFGTERPLESGGEIALARRDQAGAFDVAVVRDGAPVLTLEGYRTAALPTALPEAAAEVLGALVG